MAEVVAAVAAYDDGTREEAVAVVGVVAAEAAFVDGVVDS